MNAMLLLAQVATNLADSVASANPVLTPVSAPAEMNMLDMAIKGGWIMIVLGVLSVVCFYILFERNYMIRKAGKEDPMFMERIKDYIHSGEIKAAINYCRTINTPSARMIEKGISRLGRPGGAGAHRHRQAGTGCPRTGAGTGHHRPYPVCRAAKQCGRLVPADGSLRHAFPLRGSAGGGHRGTGRRAGVRIFGRSAGGGAAFAPCHPDPAFCQQCRLGGRLAADAATAL